MQCENGDNNETELTGKQKAGFIGALLLIGFLVIGFLRYPAYQQHREAEAAKVAQQAQRQQAQREAAAIQAAMFGPPKVKKMVQIPAGSSGTADLIGSMCFPLEFGNYNNSDAVCIGPLPEDYGTAWAITNSDGDVCIASSASPNGWSAAPGGSVTPPSGAARTTYRMHFNEEDACTPDAPNESKRGSLSSTYQFEVIEGGDPPAGRRRKVIYMD